MNNNMKKRLFGCVRLSAMLICFALLGGCGGGGVAPPPDVSFQLAAKAHEFMKVAALLFSQPPVFWGQGLRSLYYSALTLARLKDTSADVTERFHAKVWGMSPLTIRTYFDKEMKKVRTKYDYDINIDHDETASDLESFICKGVEPFECLLDQATSNVIADYKRCASDPMSCEYCAMSVPTACLKDAAITELEATRTVLAGIVLQQA